MSTQFVGEIRIFAGTFAPAGWSFCDGSLQSINDNQTLFQLIGTTYGGDGQTTFGLPDLRGRIPVHQGTLSGGNTYVLGQKAGNENITLTTGQIPAHTHTIFANSGQANSSDPAGNFFAAQSDLDEYNNSSNSTMKANMIAPAGASQPHSNIMPVMAVSYIISLYGIFPSQN